MVKYSIKAAMFGKFFLVGLVTVYIALSLGTAEGELIRCDANDRPVATMELRHMER